MVRNIIQLLTVLLDRWLTLKAYSHRETRLAELDDSVLQCSITTPCTFVGSHHP